MAEVACSSGTKIETVTGNVDLRRAGSIGAGHLISTAMAGTIDIAIPEKTGRHPLR